MKRSSILSEKRMNLSKAKFTGEDISLSINMNNQSTSADNQVEKIDVLHMLNVISALQKKLNSQKAHT